MISLPFPNLSALLSNRFIRFLFVGTLNTAFSYSCYAFFLWIGLHYSLATFIALILGILSGFVFHGKFVFQNTNHRLFRRFLIGWVFIYFIHIGLIKVLLATGLNAYLAGAASLPFVVVASFVVQKNFVFQDSQRKPPFRKNKATVKSEYGEANL